MPSSETYGKISLPRVLIVEPKLIGLPNRPELSIGARYKSNPPLPPLRFEAKYKVFPSLENAGLPSQPMESEIAKRSGVDQPPSLLVEIYKSTSGERSLLFPVFPRAKTIVLPSFEKAGVPSFAFASNKFGLNNSSFSISPGLFRRALYKPK